MLEQVESDVLLRREIPESVMTATETASMEFSSEEVVINRELDKVKQWQFWVKLAKKIVLSEQPLMGWDGKRRVMSPLGKALIGVRITPYEDARHWMVLHPWIQLLVDGIERFELDALQERRLVLPEQEIVERYQKAIAWMRSQGRSAQFKATIQRFERSSRKNHRSLSLYIDRLFENHARLLVVRLDLHYRKEVVREGNISFEEMDQHRLNLLREIKRLYGQEWVGYAWKLEFGAERSFHYHWVLFFKGNAHWRDINMAQAIGELWEFGITGGRGTYYNCNRHKFLYKSCGIGLVHYQDDKMREGLKRVVTYLTKTDYLVRYQLPNKARSFGRGEMPVIQHRGRPRTLVKGKTLLMDEIHQEEETEIKALFKND